MTMFGWWLVDVVSRLLASDEREAVLGDLAEARDGAWLAFSGVLGLVMLRHTRVWRLGLAAACGLALLGAILLVERSQPAPTVCHGSSNAQAKARSMD
jgi:hypothetical protein